MKGYSAFPEAPSLLEPHHPLVYCHIPYAEMQSAYSKALADWARENIVTKHTAIKSNSDM